MKNFYKLYECDCFKVLPLLEDRSIDMVLCDLPYGVTQNKKDVSLPLDLLWKEYKRLIKPNGAVVLTSQFPFTFDLIKSNQKWFKYDLIWNKVLVSGFLNANRMPLRVHEHILVFYEKSCKYFPQKTSGKQSHSRGTKLKVARRNYGEHKEVDYSKKHGTKKFPISIISISKSHSSVALHPTEKPVELFEYLIKTYSEPYDVILDNCLGIGTTMVACQKLKRSCIGIEIDKHYCSIAKTHCFDGIFSYGNDDYSFFKGTTKI